MNWLELFLGQIPEALFCALFIIFAKGLKEKRLLFIFIMIAEYLLLINALAYSSWFHLGYIVLTFLSLKVLYKEKSQITDTFLLVIAYIIIILISAPCVLIANNVILANSIAKALLFAIIIIFNNKLKWFQNLYKKLWNRPKESTKMKSVTFRSLNVVLFNLTFVVINIGMGIAIMYNNR